MKIAIYGAGMAGKKILSFPLRKNNEIVLLVDGNEKIWGSTLVGASGSYPIESPTALIDKEFDILLLAVINGWMDVRDKCINMGINSDKIILAEGWSKVDYYVDELDRYFDIEKKPFIPFSKTPVINPLGHCGGETGKAQARRKREGFFEKYCQGEGLDIGCGNDPVVDGVYGWDLMNGDAQYLKGVEDNSLDFVYSSHCIEHMDDTRVAIFNWFRVVRSGGYLIIYGPDRDLYEKRKMLPSRFNPHHKHMFLLGRSEAPDTLDIIEEIKQALLGKEYNIEYIKRCSEGWEPAPPDIQSPGEYSFEIVIHKC